MTCVLHLVTLILLTFAPVGVVAPVGGLPQGPLPAATLQMNGLSPAQVGIALRVASLFADAGLQLHRLEVRGSSDPADCSGRGGLHRRHDDWSEIVLCSPPAQDWGRRVVAHEFAHAWIASELTIQRKAHFQAARGWEVWHDYERAEWRENGTEQAAEIIAWGIYDRPAPVRIEALSCAHLRGDYRTLTGTEPPHPHTRLCDPPPVRRS